jgi:hypothetical protein
MEYLNKENLRKATSILGSRIFLIGAIFVLLFFLAKQCEKTKSVEADAKREYNNYLASKDSVRIIKSELNHTIAEKSAYEVAVNELSSSQKELIHQLGLKSNGRSGTPDIVIQTTGQYEGNFKSIPSRIVKDPNGNEYITFTYDPKLIGTNQLKISGKTGYKLEIERDPIDSTKYIGKVVPGGTDLTINQKIDIVTGIYRDDKTKRLMTRVSTTFPNMTFSDINSFDITDDPDTKKAMKAARKTMGFGLHLGYGLTGNSNMLTNGFYVGVGLNYTPTWLQF